MAVSASGNDLPRVPTQDALHAVDASVLDERTRKTLTDVRWLIALGLGSIAAVVVATVSTVAFAQDAGAKAVAPVAVELALVKAQQVEQERRMANVERMTVETNATLRLVAMRLGVTPVTLEPPKDGGQ
jgi:hypothetical protein